jgi:hypothetical protein
MKMVLSLEFDLINANRPCAIVSIEPKVDVQMIMG